MNKAYKYRIYPNQEQEVLINKTFGCVRFVYNKMLSERIETYEKYKEGELKKLPTPAKYKSEFEWLKEVDAHALCNAQFHLDSAFRNFFRNKSFGFPKYKSKKILQRSYTSSCVGNNIRIENDKLILPKLGKINIKLHRDIPSGMKIKSCTVSRNASRKYYASILVEYHMDIPQVTPSYETTLGLDYSSSHLYVDNLGNIPEYPKYYRSTEFRLKKIQRKYSKQIKGSKNQCRTKFKISKLHEKIGNQRKDFLHKLSWQIANAYDMVVVEDLNMQDMSQGLRLGKATHDNGFGMFRAFIKYKLEDKGKQLVVIKRNFPSSKLCHVCGYKNTELTLNDRNWMCRCGIHHDRDINAAINIKNEGYKTTNRGNHGDSLINIPTLVGTSQEVSTSVKSR